MNKFAVLAVKSSLIFFFTIIFIGGCDIDFGTGTDNGNNGGGGGIDDGEIVRGTIVDTIPGRSSGVSNIDITITDDDTEDQSTATTGSSGFFSIEGSFAGNPDIEFFDNDDSGNSLGVVILNVFPGARVDLGNISLENGIVNFLDDTEVDFTADLIDNNCSGNSGTVIVEIDLDGTDNDLEILVQITNSTDIEVDGLDADCGDFIIGQELEIRGILLIGNSVNATDIQID
ncbi:MAG: hypothetical protein ACRENO_03215 [Thermodesulfobacteriota bacterium]